MDIKEFAKSISGKEYGYPQFTKEEIETAKENGFVIALRDKNFLEFRGAMDGWILSEGGACFSKERIEHINLKSETFPNYIKEIKGSDIKYVFETKIPHEAFMIYDGGDPYCRGIVFSIDNVK